MNSSHLSSPMIQAERGHKPCLDACNKSSPRGFFGKTSAFSCFRMNSGTSAALCFTNLGLLPAGTIAAPSQSPLGPTAAGIPVHFEVWCVFS